MKELPKPAAIALLVLCVLFLAFVVVQISRSSSSGTNAQYLDDFNIETDNPQPAGKNITQ